MPSTTTTKMAGRNAKNRKNQTPRQFVLERLREALSEARANPEVHIDKHPTLEAIPGYRELRDPKAPLYEVEEIGVLNNALDLINTDTAIVRLVEFGIKVFSRGRPPSRSFSSHLARYIDGLSPVAKKRLFLEVRREESGNGTNTGEG